MYYFIIYVLYMTQFFSFCFEIGTSSVQTGALCRTVGRGKSCLFSLVFILPSGLLAMKKFLKFFGKHILNFSSVIFCLVYHHVGFSQRQFLQLLNNHSFQHQRLIPLTSLSTLNSSLAITN